MDIMEKRLSSNIILREKSPMRSLERALDLLKIMENSGGSMGLTELARASQLPKPTVLRMILVLEKYGFCEKRQGRYRLGVAVLPLAHAFLLGNSLIRVTLPVLQELTQASGETTSLFVRLGYKRVLVQRIEGRHPMRFVLPLGERLPIHVGVGKVLAAAMSDRELKEMLDELQEIRLANGKTLSHKELLAELSRVRKQGYAISMGERMLGIVAVAAPVVNKEGATIAAVSVAGAAERLTPERIEMLSIEVRDAAKMIAERYNGGSRSNLAVER
jgi:DNA-binding IclR family transcriptional regulator